MNGFTKRLAGAALALALTAAIVAASRVPYAASDADRAMIRLSWRTPGAQVEECRRVSEEELEALPVHMRREEVCERRALPYRLYVLVNGQTVYDEVVRPAGAREVRPLYVFREIPVAPGSYQVDVLWQPEGGAPAATAPDEPGALTRAEDPTADRVENPSRRAAQHRLTLSVRLALEPRDVALLTYDVDRQQLVARGRGRAESGAP
jgi:hypothetical protein